MTEISLQLDTEDLRDIYFGGGQGKVFFGPKTKKQSTFMLIALVIYPFFAYQTLNQQDSSYFIIGTLFFSLFVYNFIDVAHPLVKWRKSVNSFIHSVPGIQNISFSYTDEYFIHKQDQETSKREWKNVDMAVITNRFIHLESSGKNFLLPRNSMTEHEFESLSGMVLVSVKNLEQI